jgi:peptide/nickel transport system substrate-binding protein
VTHYGFDPAKARALLSDAGWTPGPDGILTKAGQRLTFNLSAVTGGATGEATVQIVQSQLKAIGIDAKIKNYPAELFFAPGQSGGILQSGKYDVGFFSWVAPADPDGDYSIYACNEFPPAGQNNLFWCDPTLTRALDAGRSTYDLGERKKAYGIVQSEIASQSVTIVMWFQRQIFVTLPHFHGFVPAPATTSNWNTWEWSMQ